MIRIQKSPKLLKVYHDLLSMAMLLTQHLPVCANLQQTEHFSHAHILTPFLLIPSTALKKDCKAGEKEHMVLDSAINKTICVPAS